MKSKAVMQFVEYFQIREKHIKPFLGQKKHQDLLNHESHTDVSLSLNTDGHSVSNTQ